MIIKRKHSGSYAVTPNATADDERLDADTLGVLVYLLAKPEDWKVIVADIRRRFGIGRNRVYEIIRELEAAGYVQRTQNRAAHSRWGDTEYHVFDCPQVVAGEADMAGEGHIAEGQQLPDPPLPQNGDTVKPQQITASPFTVYRPTACGKWAHLLNTKSTKSLRGEKPSANAGAATPQEALEEKKTPIADISAIGHQQPIGEIKDTDISVFGETKGEISPIVGLPTIAETSVIGISQEQSANIKVEISPLKPSGAEISAPSQMHPNVGMPIFGETKHGSPHLPHSIAEISAIGEIKGAGTQAPLPPSINQEVWKEGFDLLKTTSLKPNRSIIGKWLKRSSTKKDGKEKLLAMIRAAVKAGTPDPVAYIAKAVNDEFGALPDPKQFDMATWQRNIQAAIKTKDWPHAWGPPPGKKGCLVPPRLITGQLTTTISCCKFAA